MEIVEAKDKLNEARKKFTEKWYQLRYDIKAVRDPVYWQDCEVVYNLHFYAKEKWMPWIDNVQHPSVGCIDQYILKERISVGGLMWIKDENYFWDWKTHQI
jgi:hypothetical protein